MKNTKEKLKNQYKVVKSSFTGSNITKYSGLNSGNQSSAPTLSPEGGLYSGSQNITIH